MAVGEMVDQGREKVTELVDEGREQSEQLVERGRELAHTDEITAWIREQPLVAVGVAFGAGFLVGKVFFGDDEDSDDDFEDEHDSRDEEFERFSRSGGRRQRRRGMNPLMRMVMSQATGVITQQIRDRIAAAGSNQRQGRF